MSQQGLWSAGFVVTRGWGALFQFLWEVVIGSLNNLLGWQGSEPHYGAVRGTIQVRSLSSWVGAYLERAGQLNS